ncbi:linear amide C-N hydrolase [candidate division WOR-3 bacterium]|nr:linear amide C-N hydrolase [candidate division WOR-3 bacterium]
MVIACLWLKEAEYPDPDDRPCLNDLQWIQYQLDNFSTVEEVVNSDLSLRIDPGSVPLHFLVCDKTGACATVEYLDKELVYDYMVGSHKALTNDIYKYSLDYFTAYGSMFGNENNLMFYEDSVEDLSLAAFCILMNRLKGYSPDNFVSVIDFAFNLLKSVKYGDFSKWSIVYDLENMKVHFFTSQSEEIKSIDLKELDFSATTPVLIMDINETSEGEVNEKFSKYTIEANRALIETAYRSTPFLKDTPSEILDLISEYPETTKETEP